MLLKTCEVERELDRKRLIRFNKGQNEGGNSAKRRDGMGVRNTGN